MPASDTSAPDHPGHPATSSPKAPPRVIWDPLLRIFHWALVLSVCIGWGLGEWGPDVMTLHFWAGYITGGLIVFRLIWGVLGPRTARFSSFVRGPSAVLSYAAGLGRRQPSHWHGHNPLGALAVIAMLALLAVQVATGLMADPEDFINVGPLAHLVGYEASVTALDIHELVAELLLIIVGLHVAMILFYALWKRENLVRAMITGRR